MRPQQWRKDSRRAEPHRVAGSETYDVLVLDAANRQSLATVRALGRAGLRVAAGACAAEHPASAPVITFRSRHTARNVVLPDYDDEACGSALVSFVKQSSTTVIIPTSDDSIAALMPVRSELAALGCRVALTNDEALAVAGDKKRTLALARELGIPCPKTLPVHSLDELRSVISDIGLPAVLKPTRSRVDGLAARLYAVEVVTEVEAADAVRRFLDAGVGVLAQEWACGQREGVTLFLQDGETRAAFGHFEHRTTPALGGASVVRESAPVSPDLYAASLELLRAMGVDGPCGVEFRRNASGRPLLMEVNARLSGTVETAARCGVDFPLMTWQWATGRTVEAISTYRTGFKMRWLRGDMRWFRDNRARAGRPDSLPSGMATRTFLADFLRIRNYDCGSWRDPVPFFSEMVNTWTAVRMSRTGHAAPNPAQPRPEPEAFAAAPPSQGASSAF